MLRRALPSCLLGLLLVFFSSAAFAQYTVTWLDTNNTTTANPPDPLLINAWGLTRGPSTPWWIADEGSGWSTLYNGTGAKQGLQVVVPGANGAQGTPTGIVFNPWGRFKIKGGSSVFIFAGLDGTISGWAPSVSFTNAMIAVDNSAAGNSYTALAVTNYPTRNWIFAADNAHNKVDIYNDEFHWVGSFTDKSLPANMSVFGIRDLNGLLYVSFADINGGPGGVVDIFSEKGEWLKQLVSGGALNQPWGFAAAPSGFGPLSNTLLVSNNTDTGTINGFNAITGAWVGVVKDGKGNTVMIDQLWGIDFGGGNAADGATNELFFTAGPNNNANGLFGSIMIK